MDKAVGLEERKVILTGHRRNETSPEEVEVA